MTIPTLDETPQGKSFVTIPINKELVNRWPLKEGELAFSKNKSTYYTINLFVPKHMHRGAILNGPNKIYLFNSN